MGRQEAAMSRQNRPARSGPFATGVCACGLLLAVVVAPGVWAQTFPSVAPTQVMFDDFETTTPPRPPDDPLNGSGAIWDEWIYPAGTWTDFTYYPSAVPAQVRGGLWGARNIWEGLVSRNWDGYLIVKQSIPGNPGYVPADWTNLRVDVDLTVTRYGKPGIAWGIHDPDNDGIPDSGYLLLLMEFPTLDQAQNGNRAAWELHRIDGELSSTVVDQGIIDLPSADNYTKYMVHYRAFRMRLEWYCGNLRVRVQRIYNPARTTPTYYGCGSGCPSADPEACWCTLAEWSDSGTSLTPGATGLYHTGRRNGSGQNVTMWDNFNVSAWDPSCGSDCDPWSPWTQTSSEMIPFKLLYESGLVDYSAGRNVAGRKIDVNSLAPASTSPNNSTTTNYCNGWNLLVDLPAPGLTTDTDDIRAFLQPMATAVDYVDDGGGSFSWQDNFDNDPASATYNPVPMIADGATPINNSLLDAFDWYVDQVTTGDWANDPLKACREWYVVLITDGAESCASPGSYACDPGQAAAKFANPGIDGVGPVPVFTIGFSESVADAPPQLTCISADTGGIYYGAKNAAELSDALYEVFYTLQTEARSFTPFKISPPPSAGGPDDDVRDALVVYPIFQAAPKKSLWNGNLYGFRFNQDNASIPTTGGCSIDFSQLIVEEVSGNTWNANERLAEQLAAFDESSPTRYVFMGSDITGSWARHDLATIPTNTTLQTEFKDLLDVSGGITNLKTQEVVNFVRGVWMDDDTSASPDPNPSPRPAGSSALGDIFHSQPVLVNPPSRSMFFFDYGFNKAGEKGAHDYEVFMRKHAKRRRVVLAGANDGLWHAFDGGIWDRNRVAGDERYNEIHDLGDGSELFAFLPQAVMPGLYSMTYGTEQQYLVDGSIAAGDAFIDHDGDSTREWRTVAIASMRRGGRGMVALDITQPDPISSAPDFVPVVSDLPGCLDGGTSGCDGNEYPKVLWEFTDTTDEDTNCDGGLSGDDCEPWWDLGWTWSKPLIARIAIYNSSNENEPDDIFVAFFGGGWDETGYDRTGRHFYGINVATGEVIVKFPIGVAVPGSPTALDTDDDGFHDRIYFADSDGSVWRLQYPEPTSSSATGAEAGDVSDPGTFTRIWDFRTSFADRQMFFHRPVAVSTVVEGGAEVWALTLGSGNRADVGEIDEGVNHFFLVLDMGDDVLRDASNLLPVSYTELDGSYTCATNALDPANGRYGWYLALRPNEKVMWEAPVVAGYIVFPTFDPTPDVVAEHNVPNQCGGDPPPEEGEEGGGETPEVVCTTAGLGRNYKLWYQCGLGDYTETDTPSTGNEVYTEGNTTTVYTPKIDPDEPPEEEEFEHPGAHTVTNWRQY